MIIPRILARGSFGPDDIDVTYNEVSNRATTPEIEKQIDAHWDIFYRDAKVAGKSIWNGVTYRVNELKMTDQGKLKVEFAPIDFKTRECVTRVSGYWDMEEEYWRMGAYTGSFIKTADGYYVFVRLSGKSVSSQRTPKQGMASLVGGIMDSEVPLQSANDIFAMMYKECEEETAIPHDRISRCVLDAVYLNASTNVGFHFGIDLHDTKQEVEDRFRSTIHDDEIHDMFFVEPKYMLKQLEETRGTVDLLEVCRYAEQNDF